MARTPVAALHAASVLLLIGLIRLACGKALRRTSSGTQPPIS
ncbi:MAG: hypothetical protein OXI37_07815 [Gammaproteobacteria bacterium]|nr:hypothetical protein [Gammaproteobacteria bacterium]